MRALRMVMVTVFLLSIMATGAYAANDGKIGYVDLSRLFDEYHKTKEYDKVLEVKHGELEKVGKEKVEKIKESESRLALLKEDQRTLLESEIEMLKGEAQEFVRQEQSNLTKDRNEKIREILLEIEKVVSDFAVKEGYDVILNDRVLIYGDPAQDLTEDILTILNK
ncbi:MAG: OmpH family outer membrane protein [Candidatus Omnitrophica bacterium]|nr:OmpH family outer membrane protein [Candidatus Omnitrophota bacterium]MCK5260321.1 OmpH family outer membrane protein [Candidatus Omnitrophota bacterium]